MTHGVCVAAGVAAFALVLARHKPLRSDVMTLAPARAAVVIAVALLGAVVPCDARADDEAAALIAKHAAYVGWHAGDRVVKTLRLTGEGIRDGKRRYATSSLRYGAAHRDTLVADNGLQYDEGFTGSVAWTSSENGFTVRVIGDAVRALFDREALFGETTTTAAFTAKIQRTDRVDGVACTVVRLTSQVGFPMHVCIDAETGAYRRAVLDPDGPYESVLNGLAYTAVDGKGFLSAWRYGDSETRWSYTKLELNAAVEPDALRPPKQTSSWTFGDTPATIEYVDQPEPRIYLDAVVNGRKGKFVFDTGAAGTVMTDSFVRATGAKRFGTQRIGGIGPGSVEASLFRVESVGGGGSTLHDVIVSGGLDEVTFGREGVAGLIGFDLLAATIAELNIDTRTLRLMDPARNEVLVGLDFMRAFNFVFDYPDGIVVMIPRQHY